MHRKAPLAALALALTGVLALAGCASGGADAAATSDVRLTIVASTSVYGQIVEEIGGEFVDVTSIVSSGAQDPHSFEASARDQLAVQRADVIIENGGGYDAFIDSLIDASGSTAPVLTAAEFSHDWPENEGHTDDASTSDHDHADHEHVEGFNEHVWYDAHTMDHLAEAIAQELSDLLPEQADTFAANAATFSEGVAGLEGALADIAADHAGGQVFVTEPVPLYLVEAAQLVNVTPAAFTEAVEEGQDVAPSTLLDAMKLLRSGEVGVVIVNSQTGGAETTQVIDEAKTSSIPVLEFSETLPEHQTYLSWMQANIEALAGALTP
jgi:zinc/manganese transport system substrate-binding protein